MPRIDDLGLRADTAAGWAAAEVAGPVTSAGENVWIDNDLVKCDGVTKVANLPRAGSGTYAAINRATPGNLGVAIGDSLTQGSQDNTTQAVGESWFAYACAMSGQTIQFARNAGVAGNTTQNMIDRFDTDVTPYGGGTWASRGAGIGAAIAHVLARDGARVLCLDVPAAPVPGAPVASTASPAAPVAPLGTPLTTPIRSMPTEGDYVIGQAVPKAPEGYVHKLAANGQGYLYTREGRPVFESKAEVDARGLLLRLLGEA